MNSGPALECTPSPGLPPSSQDRHMLEDRLVHIETKIAFQEDMIEELSKTIYQQQQKLERLEAVCRSLAGHIEALSAAKDGGMPANERPPHY
jgi:SlyX protein